VKLTFQQFLYCVYFYMYTVVYFRLSDANLTYSSFCIIISIKAPEQDVCRHSELTSSIREYTRMVLVDKTSFVSHCVSYETRKLVPGYIFSFKLPICIHMSNLLKYWYCCLPLGPCLNLEYKSLLQDSVRTWLFVNGYFQIKMCLKSIHDMTGLQFI